MLSLPYGSEGRHFSAKGGRLLMRRITVKIKQIGQSRGRGMLIIFDDHFQIRKHHQTSIQGGIVHSKCITLHMH